MEYLLSCKHDSNYFFEKINSNYFFAAADPKITNMASSISQATSFAEESDFQGIGPLIGVDASYYVGMGFGIVGHFDSALLVGNIDEIGRAHV